MGRLGQRFKQYVPLGVERVEVPKAGFKTAFDTVSFQCGGALKKKKGGGGGRRVAYKVAQRGLSSTELNKPVIGVAPTANTYQIPADQKDLATVIKNTLSDFDYYVVELGLNVMLGRKFRIPELRFEVDLKCDGSDRTKVTAYDIAPDDKIKRVKIISGKVSLGVTKLLKLIPSPIGAAASDLLDIKLNPWEFEWGFDKYMIDAAGRKNYCIFWKIYKTNTVQRFNPTMILKVRKSVKKISATARAIYRLNTGWGNSKVLSKAAKIKILPK